MRKWSIVAVLGLAALGAGLLVGCASDVAFKAAAGAPAAGQSASEHGQAIAAEGAAEGNPVKSWLGLALQVVGAVTAAVGGVGVVAKRVADKAPWTAEEKADIKAIAADKPVV